MEVMIRKAQIEDVAAMLVLVKELASFEREPDAVEVTEEAMREAGFGEKPVWWGWVAECRSENQMVRRSDDGNAPGVVGMAICYERYSTWKGRCLYLEDLVVTESARGHGIGDRLLKACAEYAVLGGHHHMLWQVLDWNKGAIRFYQRYNAEFSAEWLNVRLGRDRLVEVLRRES